MRKLLTGDLKAPFASYPPFPGDTEAQYLRYSVYLLYWYKSTNTDADGGAVRGSRFWCTILYFTGTKVRILTQKAVQRADRVSGAPYCTLLVQKYVY